MHPINAQEEDEVRMSQGQTQSLNLCSKPGKNSASLATQPLQPSHGLTKGRAFL